MGKSSEKNEADQASFTTRRLVQVVVESVVNPDGYPRNPSTTAYPQGTRIKHYLTAGTGGEQMLNADSATFAPKHHRHKHFNFMTYDKFTHRTNCIYIRMYMHNQNEVSPFEW